MKRSRLGTAAAIGAAYHFLARPRLLTWGTTPEEAAMPLPGDEIKQPVFMRSTMAVTIDAPPEGIWPWLVQMGWQRGGFYSYNLIEQACGLDLHNADRIVPVLQHLKVGDPLFMSHPRLDAIFPETRVETLEENRALVLAILPPKNAGLTEPGGAWSFVLQPIDERRTRVLVRLQVALAPQGFGRRMFGRFLFYSFMEPSHFIMQRGGLLGLKARVEGSPMPGPAVDEEKELLPV